MKVWDPNGTSKVSPMETNLNRRKRIQTKMALMGQIARTLLLSSFNRRMIQNGPANDLRCPVHTSCNQLYLDHHIKIVSPQSGTIVKYRQAIISFRNHYLSPSGWPLIQLRSSDNINGSYAPTETSFLLVGTPIEAN